ncbi:MAG: hypothetical protein V4722_22110 [Bacteroidota bacterium]
MKEIQLQFLERLSKLLGPSKLLATELEGCLGISKSQAYNKMSGKTMLSIEEILLLCEKYGLHFTIDKLNNRTVAPVSFMPFRGGRFSVEQYLVSLENFLYQIASAKQKKLTCATDDIPIFHLFKYPEIAAFKLYFWNARLGKNQPFLFDHKMIDTGISASAAHLHQLYQSIPTVEIWTKSSLYNTMEQLRYAVEAKIITDKGLGQLICAQLRSTLKDIENYAVSHEKQNGILFEWYFYDIIGCITYFAETDGSENAFLRFNTFNTMQVEKGPLCDEVKFWLDSVIQDSTGFSGHGRLQRNRFLEEAYSSCNELEELFL